MAVAHAGALHDLIRFRRFLRGIPPFLAQHDTTRDDRGVHRFAAAVSRASSSDSCIRCCSRCGASSSSQFKQFAAYNALFYLGAALPDGLRPPQQLEIPGGMRTYVDALARDLERAEVQGGARRATASPATGEVFVVRDVAGVAAGIRPDRLATGPGQALALTRSLQGMEPVSEQLRRFRTFDTTIAIHGDRSLMPPSESAWSVVNVRWDGTHSQLSIWNPERGLPVFRSWVTFEERLPEPLYAVATYEHLLVTVDHFDAQARLKALRGHGGVWLAGLYMDDADSHESAVRSAVTIARELAPDSARLRLLLGERDARVEA